MIHYAAEIQSTELYVLNTFCLPGFWFKLDMGAWHFSHKVNSPGEICFSSIDTVAVKNYRLLGTSLLHLLNTTAPKRLK